jgi:hypothetical protein
MYRLIYKSRCSEAITWDSVREILHVSEKNNAQNQITGVLLASKTHFLQVIEGRFDAVNHTFFSIACDPRHTEIQLISFGCVEARLFEHWGMKGIGAFDFNEELADTLKQKYGEEQGDILFPLSEWKALSLIHDIDLMRDQE